MPILRENPSSADEHDDDEDTFDEINAIGISGLVHCVLLIAIIVWRTAAFVAHTPAHERSGKLFIKRLIFHCLLMLTIICDTPMYISFVTRHRYELETYAFHKLESAWLFMAFSVVVSDWLAVLYEIKEDTESWYFFKRLALIICNLMVTAISLANFGDCLKPGATIGSFVDSGVYQLGILSQLISVLLLTGVILQSGMKLAYRLRGATEGLRGSAVTGSAHSASKALESTRKQQRCMHDFDESASEALVPAGGDDRSNNGAAAAGSPGSNNSSSNSSGHASSPGCTSIHNDNSASRVATDESSSNVMHTPPPGAAATADAANAAKRGDASGGRQPAKPSMQQHIHRPSEEDISAATAVVQRVRGSTSSGIVVQGWMTKRKLAIRQGREAEFLTALRRLNIVMATCVMCNLLGVTMEGLNLLLGASNSAQNYIMNVYVFWACYSWAPLWGPVIALLYLVTPGTTKNNQRGMNRRRRNGGGGKGRTRGGRSYSSGNNINSSKKHQQEEGQIGSDGAAAAPTVGLNDGGEEGGLTERLLAGSKNGKENRRKRGGRPNIIPGFQGGDGLDGEDGDGEGGSGGLDDSHIRQSLGSDPERAMSGASSMSYATSDDSYWDDDEEYSDDSPYENDYEYHYDSSVASSMNSTVTDSVTSSILSEFSLNEYHRDRGMSGSMSGRGGGGSRAGSVGGVAALGRVSSLRYTPGSGQQQQRHQPAAKTNSKVAAGSGGDGKAAEGGNGNGGVDGEERASDASAVSASVMSVDDSPQMIFLSSGAERRQEYRIDHAADYTFTARGGDTDKRR
jgi:hypothetical protein